MKAPLPEPGKYCLYDYESGWPYQVTKEVYEQHQAMMAEMSKRIMEMVDPPLKPQLIVFGTGGDFDNNNFHEMFYNSPNYDIKPFTNIWQDNLHPPES